jgi:hypothetical protein
MKITLQIFLSIICFTLIGCGNNPETPPEIKKPSALEIKLNNTLHQYYTITQNTLTFKDRNGTITEINNPKIQTLNHKITPTDKLNKITFKRDFSWGGTAYRTKTKSGNWTDWKPLTQGPAIGNFILQQITSTGLGKITITIKNDNIEVYSLLIIKQ